MPCDTWSNCFYQERDAFITSWWSPDFCNLLFPLYKIAMLTYPYFSHEWWWSLSLKYSSGESMSHRDIQNYQLFVLHTSSFLAYWLLQIAFQMPDNETLHYSRTTSAGTSYIHNTHKPTKGPISHHNVTFVEKVLLVLSNV